MSDLFESEDKMSVAEVDDDEIEAEAVASVVDEPRLKHANIDARRRLEALMEEKRLKNELNDYFDE